VIEWVAPGVGFEPTRPKGAQAICPGTSPVELTVPGKGPTIIANQLDCPVPGSGIPARSERTLEELFPTLGSATCDRSQTIEQLTLGLLVEKRNCEGCPDETGILGRS